MLDITADEQDLITELMNIGVGHAAAAFSRMIGEEIRMTVPFVQICARDTAAALLRERLPELLAGVRQTFQGPLTGVAALIFPERQSLQIIRTVLHEGNFPLEEITELEQETFLEIGNIVLNHCLGTISNVLGLTCRSSPPQPISDGENGLFIDDGREGVDAIVLFLHITFTIQSVDVTGYLTFLLDMQGANRFLSHVRQHLAKAIGA